MANDIRIFPNSARITFSGTSASTIELNVEADGSLSFVGNSGTLFSLVDDLTGSLFSVNTSAGIPVFEAFADNTITMGSFSRKDFYLDGATGYVGLGTDTPSEMLQVSGNTIFGSTSASTHYFKGQNTIDDGTLTIDTYLGNFQNDSTNPTVELQYIGTPYGRLSIGNNWQFILDNPYAGASDGGIHLSTQGNIALTVDKSQNVGIGTTSPAVKFHVVQNTAASLVNRIEQDNASYEAWYEILDASGNYARYGISTDTNDYAFFNTDKAKYGWYGAGGTGQWMTFTNGNVGINQTNPQYGKLEVAGTLAIGGTGGDAILRFIEVSNGWNIRHVAVGNRLAFSDVLGGTDHFNITESGDVGIGVISPTYKLQVDGDISLNGTEQYLRFNAGNDGYIGSNSANQILIRIRDNEALRVLGNSGGEFVRFDAATGHVGFNSTAPEYQVHIYQPSGELGFGMTRSAVTTGGTAFNISLDSSKTRLNYYGDLAFFGAAIGNNTPSQRAVITSGGNFGIAQASPSEKLQVAGNIYTEGGSIKFSQTNWDFTANSRTQNTSPMSMRLFDVYNDANSPGSVYGTLLDIYGRSGHLDSTLLFDSGGRIFYREAFYLESSYGTWQEIAYKSYVDAAIQSAVSSGDTLQEVITNDPDFTTAMNYTGTGRFLDIGGAAAFQVIGSNNRGIAIGRDDMTIIGAGEMNSTMVVNLNGTSEQLHLGAEGGVFIYTSPDNLTSGWGGRNTWSFNTDGTTSMPGKVTAFGALQLETSNPTIILEETDVADKNYDIQVNGGDFIIYEVNDARSTFNNRFTILDTSGNVGIGVVSPAEKLQVEGNLLVNVYNTSGNTGGIFFRQGFTSSQQYNASIMVYDHSGGGTGPTDGISINGFDGVSFSTGSNTRNERMRITQNGDVAIGSTTALNNFAAGSTTTKLAVHGGTATGYTEVAHFAAGSDADDTGAIVRIGHVGNDRGLFFKTGRGTSNQVKTLIGHRDANNSDINIITITTESTGIENVLFQVGDNGSITFNRGANDLVKIYDNGANNDGILEVYNSSNVAQVRLRGQGDNYILQQFGLGLTNPAYQLHVLGDANVDGKLIIGDTATAYDDVEIYSDLANKPTGYEGYVVIVPATIPGSGTSDHLTHFKTGTGAGVTNHDVLIDNDLEISGTTTMHSELNVNGSISINNRIYDRNDTTNYIEIDSDYVRLVANNNGIRWDSQDFYPESDNASTLGRPSNRWDILYIGTGGIFTDGGLAIQGATQGTALTFPQATYQDWDIYRTNNTLYVAQDGTGGAEFSFVGDGSNYDNAYLDIGTDVRLRSNGDSYFLNNLGIGTTDPTEALHVSGNTLISNTTSSGNTVFAVDGTFGRLFSITDDLTGSLFAVNTIAGFPVIEAWADNTVTLGSYSRKDFYLDGITGYIGLGIDTPSNKLHVITDADAPARFESTTNLVRIVLEDTSTSAYLGQDGTAGKAFFGYSSTATSTNLTVTNTGSVGIGTTSPNYKLEVDGGPSQFETTPAGSGTEGIRVGGIRGLYTAGSDNQGLHFYSNVDIGYPNGWGGGLANTPTRGLSSYGGANLGYNSGDVILALGGGKVGIGISSPSALLTLANNDNDTTSGLNLTNSSGTIYGGLFKDADTETVKLFAQRTNSEIILGNASEGMLYVGTGTSNPYYRNVGIGTASPLAKLHAEISGTGDIFKLNRTDAGGYITVDFAGEYSNLDSFAGFTFARQGAEKMRLTNTGLGIGTTTPGAKLTVVQTATGEGFRVDGASGGYGLIVNGGTDNTSRIRALSIGNSYVGTTPPSNGLIVEGNVGIGMEGPSYKLDVFGTVDDKFNSSFGNQLGVGQWTGIHFGYKEPGNDLYKKSGIIFERTDSIANNATGKIHIVLENGTGADNATIDDAKLTIDESGNVGIGTINPSAKFHVFNTNYPQIALQSNGGTWQFGISSGNDFAIRRGTTGSNYPLWIDDLDNVGIGTTSPTYKLDVLGNFRTTGFWTSNSGVSYWGSSGSEIGYGVLTWGTGFASIYSTSGKELRLGSNNNQGIVVIDNNLVDIGSIVNIETTDDQKLTLRVPSGDSTDWNYIAFFGEDGVRDGIVGTDNVGRIYLAQDSGAIMQFTSTSGTININGNRIWHAGDFTSSDITNWNTAYGWGDWSTGVNKTFIDALNVDADTLDGIDSTGFVTRQTTSYTDPNSSLISSMRRYNPHVNNPNSSDYFSVITYGNQSNVVGQFATNYVTGESFVRAYNTSWSNWRRLWDDSDFNGTTVANWSTAYDRSLTSIGFSGGSLTLTRQDTSTYTVSLDGRYSLLAHTHTTSDITNLSSYTGFDARYFTETEIDNFFSGVTAVAGYNKANWDAAYGWGDWSTGVDKAFVDALNVDADTLDGLNSTIFLRTDVGDTYSASSYTIYANTSDGSDNKRIVIGGGGTGAVSRGAYVAMHGNEYSGSGGDLILTAGSTGKILMNGTIQLNNSPVNAPSEQTALMYNGTDIVSRELGTLAFSSATYDNYSSWIILADSGTPGVVTTSSNVRIFGGDAIKTNIVGLTVTIDHDDTSTQTSVNNSNGTVIQDVTLDDYGHITALGSVNLDSRYILETGDTMTGKLTLKSNTITNSSTTGTVSVGVNNTNGQAIHLTLQSGTTLTINFTDMVDGDTATIIIKNSNNSNTEIAAWQAAGSASNIVFPTNNKPSFIQSDSTMMVSLMRVNGIVYAVANAYFN